MTEVVLDQATLAKLRRAQELVKVRDEHGSVVGYFHPVLNASDYEGLEPPMSEEEIERRLREPGGRPLAEILADLEKRA
jgi:hypothetical protein